MSAMPDHFIAHLIATGVITGDGISRRARARTCRTCGRLVIAGLDHDRTALAATVDPTPLDPTGELIALLTGKTTYTLRASINAYQIDIRWPEAIIAHPAGTAAQYDTVATHQCGKPINTTATSRITTNSAHALPTECPF